MNDRLAPTVKLNQPKTYEIRVKGHLDGRWANWFSDLTIMLEDSGNTLLTGLIIDQPALYGLLRKIRDCGLPLLSVICTEDEEANASQSKAKPIYPNQPKIGDTK